MKSRWTWTTIGECCELTSGGTPSKHNVNFWLGDVPFVSARDLKSDRIEDALLHISHEAVRESAAKIAPIGTLLMLVRGMGLANGIQAGEVVAPVAFNQDIKAIHPPSALIPRFLLLALKSSSMRVDGESILSSAAHGTLKIDTELLRQLPVPVPPLPEQRRIVGILEEAFEGIATARANAEKNLENARDLFESQREATLSPRANWRLSPLGDLCEIKHGFAFKGKFFVDSGEFVLLTPGNFYERGGYRDRGKKQKFYSGEIPDGYVLKRGDLLVAMTEQAAGLLGSPLLVPDSDRFLHNQRLGLIVPKSNQPWSSEFFFHVFNLKRVRKQIHDEGTGAKVRHTSPGRIHAVEVAYPDSAASQRAVAERLVEVGEEVERLESIYQQKLAALDELKKSLLHRAFSGQL